MTTKKITTVCAAVLALSLLVVAAHAAPGRSDKKKPKPTKKNVVTVMVDLRRIIQEAKCAQKLQADLMAWQNGLKVQVQPKLDELKQKQDAYKAMDAKTPKEEKDKKYREIEALRQELQQRQGEAQAEFQAREAEAAKKFHDVYEPVLSSLADEFGWDIIMNKSDQNALWISDAVDQTDIVLERLDEATTTEPPPAPAAPAQ